MPCMGSKKLSKLGTLTIKDLKATNKNHKQVDILISKNQVLQILHLKHYVYKTS